MNDTPKQVTTDQSNVPEMSPAEIREARGKRAAWYREQITFLEPQLHYQEMVSRIESAKATTAEAQLKQAQIYLALKAGQAPPGPRSDKRPGAKKGTSPVVHPSR